MLRVWLGGGLRLEAGGDELPPPASRRARGRARLPGAAPRPARARRSSPPASGPTCWTSRARTSLRAALSELRRALGPAAAQLVATREAVALGGGDLEVDARRFEEALRRGHPAGSAESVSRRPILDGFDDDWAHEARRSHGERLAETLERLAVATSDPGEAVRLTRGSRWRSTRSRRRPTGA